MERNLSVVDVEERGILDDTRKDIYQRSHQVVASDLQRPHKRDVRSPAHHVVGVGPTVHRSIVLRAPTPGVDPNGHTNVLTQLIQPLDQGRTDQLIPASASAGELGLLEVG